MNHFAPFKEYPLTKTGTENGYDIFTGKLPFDFHYVAGGGDSGFLKQAQPIRLVHKGLEEITITVNVNRLDAGHREEGPNKFWPDDVYFNVNDAQHLLLEPGETFNLLPIRVWQAQTDVVSNFFIEPDYHVEVLNGNGEVTATPAGSPGLEYYALTGVSPGLSIIRVTYGPIEWYKIPKPREPSPIPGAGTLGIYEDYELTESDKDIYFNAINPLDTGIVIVNVVEDKQAANTANLKTNIDRREYDTAYFDRETTDHDTYTLSPADAGGTGRVQHPRWRRGMGGRLVGRQKESGRQLYHRSVRRQKYCGGRHNQIRLQVISCDQRPRRKN